MSQFYIAFDEERKDRITLPQESPEVRSFRTGSGLSLFISKGIVEVHGGKVWAENNAEGKGATFSLTLPTVDREIPQADNV
ncbi:MAG TPA: ATP-binding protein [Candidatus Bathyarchaeia archaeon]|nr:ATP-binding protein [Candidatus Bathyarchaeia archaeon]